MSKTRCKRMRASGWGARLGRCGWLVVLAMMVRPAWAEVTPLDTPLADDKITQITCEYKGQEQVFIGEANMPAQPGTYHYKVYIPPGYNDAANAKRQYPCLFVCSGSGNPSLRDMQDWVRRNRWIVVLVSDAKNGPWPPIFGAFLGAHDDAVKRLRVSENLKFAMGASGGAAMTGYGITVRRGFVAWLPFIGSAPSSKAKQMRGLVVHGVFGRGDKGAHAAYIRGFIREFQHLQFSWTSHAGGHTWGGVPMVSGALEIARDRVLATVRLSPADASCLLEPLAAEFEDQATLPGRKHELATQVRMIAPRARLSRDAAWAPRLTAMGAFLKEVRRDKKLGNEVAAYTAWMAVKAKQEKLENMVHIGDVPEAQAPALRERLANDLMKLRQKYADSETIQRLDAAG
jgi:hypothetical protein